jgi:hypothetical protein
MMQRPWLPRDAPLKHGGAKSLASPDWHYIEHETLGVELYDWVADSRESQNLAGSQKGQEVVSLFKRSLQTILTRN